MHSYQYAATRFERVDDGKRLISRIHGPSAYGDVRAAERLVLVAREELEFCESQAYRHGKEGDDPVRVMADNAYLDMRRNLATEAVIRAEGMLLCARARLADYQERLAAQQEAAT
jgi:hypothetical protein